MTKPEIRIRHSGFFRISSFGFRISSAGGHMTRETKIGLLVGLAFIIVIGILLSDHLTSSTEPPPAPLAGAGSSVRAAGTTPAGPGNPPITTVTAPQGIAPQQTVPTRNELTAARSSPV